MRPKIGRQVRATDTMRLVRFHRARYFALVLAFAGAAVSIKMFATGSLAWGLTALGLFASNIAALRYLMPCRHCGESMLWWSARHTRSWDLFGAIDRLEVCPYCGRPLDG